MLTQARKISLKLISIWVILGMLFPLFAQPLKTYASPKAVPSNCTGEDITLVEGEANVTIENPTITNASVNGCTVSGSMRIVFRGNNKGAIPIYGSVDAFDNFQASSIGYFALDIAGLTLKAYNATYTTDNDGALKITWPNIKIPDAWGGLEAQIPSTTQLDKGGLQIVRFKLPSLQTQKGFVLDLSGQLRMASTGYELDADGSLSLPDIGKTSGCAISAGVTLYASVLGQGVIEIHTPEGAQAASLRSNRSTIKRPDGLASLAPAHLAVNSYYLPVPSDLPPDAWLQGEVDTPAAPPLEAQSLPVANARLASSMAMVAPYAAADEQATGPSFIPPGEEEAVAAGQAYAWALWEEGNYAQPLLSSADFPEQELAHDAFDSAMIGPLEEETALSPEALELREIRASASCSKGIPIANTGFELTGVNGVISLRPNSQFVQIGVTIESSVKVASFSALKLEAYAKFQWNPEFAGEIGGALYVLTMFKVAEAKVSLSESDGFRTTVWMRGFVWEITVSIHAWTKDQRFHFTGSGQARVGVGKGQIWQGCIPYPCGVRWCYKMVWKVKIWYPCGVNICDGCISVPPIDLWLGGLGADFGEFVGGVYGFKAYVSFLGYTTGVFVNHKGEIKFGNVSGYRLIGTMQLAQAYKAWQAARLNNATSFAGDDTFTFLADDKVRVHFDLPLENRYRVPLSVSDAITPVNVITQTDTLFSVKSDTPLEVSLISPDGIEITADNYDQSPGGYVIGYRQIVTYTLERATSTSAVSTGSKEEQALAQTRWRFISVSPDPVMAHVDVALDTTAVFTDVWITGTQRIDYALVEPGPHTISVMPSGSSEVVLTATLEAITGTQYTVLAVGDPATALMLDDDNGYPGDFGQARVRAVNVVSPTIPITVSLGDWNMNLEYGQAGEYLTVPAGEYPLFVPSNAATQPTQTAALDNLSVITLTAATNDNYGNAIASAGDVNGDGYDDILIGAWGYDGNAGLVHLYYGNMTSIASIPITLTGAMEGHAFGISVSSAGDVNGDGYADVIIGAMGATAAYVYYGSAQGLSIVPDVTLYGESGESYGSSVSTAGDINGDGFADVLVAADGWNGSIGRVYVYIGSAEGLTTTPAVTLTGEGLPGSDLGGAEFGAAVGTAGDVNNDGYSDIIIGADGYEGFTGAALVYYGSPAGDLITYTLLTGAAPMDNFGWATGTAGDVNNDGYDDVIVGAYSAAPTGVYWSGGAYIYHGGPDGLSTTPALTLTGQPYDYFGVAVGTAGDVNNDGYDDVMVGASYAAGERGQVYIYLGSAEGIAASAALTLTDEMAYHNFGYEVATAGDVNGDGFADFIVSAQDYYSSRVYVYVSPGSAANYWLEPTTATFAEGDVQTLIFTPFGDATFPVGYLNATDERYKVMTETQFIVDQAVAGTWSVQLVGDTGGQLVVGAIAAPNPPVISDLTVDASTLAQTKVSYRLLSDYLPATISVYANDGPITETMVVTESIGPSEPVTKLKDIPLYAGTAVYTITLTDENAVKGEIVTETVDLSWLESGNYTLWVRAEDGVSPPVQGYVWSTPTMARAASLNWALNQVRVAAEGYDPLAQLAGAINISIDQTATFTDHWTTVITPTVNPLFITRNEQGELVETLIDGLFVEFTPNTHPDVDSYVVHVSDLANTYVITTGLTTSQLYDALGDPVGGPINYVVFNGINPKTTYSIVIAAIDWDSDITSWSNAHVTTVPLGDFGMQAQTPVVTVPAGQEIVTLTLVLTQTADLFADISLYLDSQHLPGIKLKSLAYEYVGMSAAAESSWLSIPAAMRMPAAVRAAPTADIHTILARVALTVPTTLLPGIYTLPFRGYSGELQRETSVNLVVGEAQQLLISPDALDPVVIMGDLPLPNCAQAITVTIPPGSFAVTSTFEFRQGTNNVAPGMGNYQFANVRFFLSAFTYPERAAIAPLKPISLTLRYDEACLVGLHEDRLRLLTLAAPQVWLGTGISCTIDAQDNMLDCSLENLGEFALFEYIAKIYLPLVLK